uniref:Uncharacterized protein n=1 Tax=Triticum urartu TaxID=4572 RepID=A0A8R7V7T1_TRIUA
MLSVFSPILFSTSEVVLFHPKTFNSRILSVHVWAACPVCFAVAGPTPSLSSARVVKKRFAVYSSHPSPSLTHTRTS